ncbi:DUF2247 family protein [Bacillus spizizenii]|uniref:DUF2247 family protein n=1 Tax=Bacillus spizizenii TaxID=96241 RepID=UPI00227F2945|nr:DUF2247 family protein [Bacillus spizizenii]MCY7762840.1 DUF2247 family protein [Bacillus spizizenii]MCY8061994.1 DUF2247 family protein [Bacillus spizizenii]MCY8133594.1 DUF2247 family protein [Bacillus spizizenii]MCY8257033.1 DUF2247 family protein [Bacillus spizizenii]MCY8332590.1 DUF2247 family protein [Bacillus spizizenii]
MKITLNTFKVHHVNYDWKTLYVGLKQGWINKIEVMNYAVEYLMNHPVVQQEEILELAWGDKDEIEEAILNIIRVEENSFYAIKKRKWRYVILLEGKSKYSDHATELLSKLAEVYAVMNSSEDMEDFIHYQPSYNGCNLRLYSYEQNINRLCNLFQDFLVKEKQNIQNGLSL